MVPMAKKRRKCPLYTYEPGREIYRSGKPFISVTREGSTKPTKADATARRIVRLLNKGCK